MNQKFDKPLSEDEIDQIPSLNHAETKKFLLDHGFDVNETADKWSEGMPVLVLSDENLKETFEKRSKSKLKTPSLVIIRDVISVVKQKSGLLIINLDSSKKRYSMVAIDRTSLKPIVVKTEHDLGRQNFLNVYDGSQYYLTEDQFLKLRSILGSKYMFNDYV